MKTPLSSSTSSTSSTFSISTTTASNDGNLETPRNNCRRGCISTVLRRILRRKILATHPSDHHKNTESCSSEKPKCSLDQSTNKVSGTPNLVAKLMGLESIPIGDLKKDLSSVTRSRSMNSAESWKGFEAMQGRPRRTKSFREIPSFHELQDDNFYIFSFEKGNKNRKLASNVKKSEKGFTESENVMERGGRVLGEVKHSKDNRGSRRRESVYEKNKENLIVARNFSQRSGSETELRDKTNAQDQKGTIDSGISSAVKLPEPLSKKKETVGGKKSIEKRKDCCLAVRTNETDNNSQNSNPDSVLDEVQLPVNCKFCNATNQEVSSRLTSSKSRRTLWEELENFSKLTTNGKVETFIHNNQGAKESNENGDGSSKIIDFESKIHAEILKKSCKLAEKEMLKSNWMLKEACKLEGYEKVGEDLEACILGTMINELVDQLIF